MAQIKFTTPLGTFAFPRLNRPSQQYGKFEVNLVMGKADAESIVTSARKLAVEEFGRTKAPKVKYPFDINTETGEVTLKARSAHMPALVQANGQPYPEDDRPNVGGGTVGRLSVTFKTYTDKGGGVTCYLNGAQVKKLVEFSSSGFSSLVDDKDDAPVATDGGFGDLGATPEVTEEAAVDGFDF